MHSDEAASRAAVAACEQQHSGVRSFGGALRRGVARIWLRGRGNLPWRNEVKRQSADQMASLHVDSYGSWGYLKGSLRPELETCHTEEKVGDLRVAMAQTPRRGLAFRPAGDAEVSYL